MKTTRIGRPYLILLTVLLCLLAIPVTALADDDDDFDPDQIVPAWNCTNKADAKMSAEAGLTLDMSSYMYNNYFSTTKKAVWTSSNKSVAAFTKSKGRGILKTKKPGKTILTLTYKKKAYKCTLTVKKKGSLIKGKFKTFSKAQAAVLKYKKTKITARNYAKIQKAAETYEKYRDKLADYADNGTKNDGSVIYVPVEASDLATDLSIRIDNFYRKQVKGKFTIKGVEAGAEQGTVVLTLGKKITALQAKAISRMQKNYDMSDIARYAELYEVEKLQEEMAESSDPGKTLARLVEEARGKQVYVDFTFKKDSDRVTVKLTDEETGKPCQVTENTVIMMDPWSEAFKNAKTPFIVK